MYAVGPINFWSPVITVICFCAAFILFCFFTFFFFLFNTVRRASSTLRRSPSVVLSNVVVLQGTIVGGCCWRPFCAGSRSGLSLFLFCFLILRRIGKTKYMPCVNNRWRH